jgi:hypothetical protein
MKKYIEINYTTYMICKLLKSNNCFAKYKSKEEIYNELKRRKDIVKKDITEGIKDLLSQGVIDYEYENEDIEEERMYTLTYKGTKYF